MFNNKLLITNNKLPIISIENPALVHFRHFSSLLTIFSIYICRDTSTNVMSALQINLFLQNEPNFRKSQVNVTAFITREYVQMDTWSIRKNEPKTNPNEPNTNPILANKTTIRTQTNPIRTQFKPNLSCRSPLAKQEQTQFQTRCTLSGSFLFFTFLCPGYNLPMQTWTIQRLLNWMTDYYTEKGIEAPRLNAELLLSHVLKMERIELYTGFDKTVTKERLDTLHDLVKRAGRHEPISYLTGKTEFYSLRFQVSPDTMIPRPETELLVEHAIEFLRTRPGKNSAMQNIARKQDISNGSRTGPQFVCDLCTGCGCIAVAIAKNRPEAKIIATDISDAALNIAAKNIENHNLKDRITLLCGDLFEPIVPQLDVEKFDLIVCNPPYVSTSEFEKLDKCVKDYEPRLALFAGDDGLDVYRRIIDKADRFLSPDGALILEIGYAQGPAIKELLEKTAAFAEIKIEKDYNNNDRIATALKESLLPGL